jgi:hypothetical protein
MLQLCPVPFCARGGFGLRSDADKARVVAELRDSFGVRAVVPAADGRRYRAAEHARDLRGGGRYVAALRSRGSPALLYLTRVDGCGVCMFVYRRVFAAEGHTLPRIVLARLGFAERAFDGTVLDGELVRLLDPAATDKDGKRGIARWVFVVGDVLADCGEPLMGEDAVRRLERLQRLLSPEWHRPDLASDPCFVRARQHFTVARLRQVVEGIPALDYEVTGVVFRSLGRLGDPGDEDVVFSLPGRRALQQQQQQQRRPDAPDAPDATDAELEDEDGAAEHFDGLSVYDAPPQPGEAAPREQPARFAFYMRRTAMPDVYELYETAQGASEGRPGAPIAGVPTLAASEALREACVRAPNEPVWFEMSAKFGKWVPEPPGRTG